MRKKLLLLMLLILALLPGKSLLAQDTADWTILYYIAADNDLEGFQMNDIMELNLVGSTDKVNIIAQIDRIPGFDQVNGDFTDTRRYYVTATTSPLSGGDFAIQRQALIDELAAIDPAKIGKSQADWDAAIAALKDVPQEQLETLVTDTAAPPGGGLKPIGIDLTDVESVGETSTGDPQTLVDFATWGISNYPAQKYMLMINDHGGGWTGVAFDETSDNNPLTMPELGQALEQITSQTGIGKFDVVGFDACLMAQLEVYNTIAPYAQYAIASEEIIPGSGWQYVTPMQAITRNPQALVKDIGKGFVDGYIDYYTNVMTRYTAFDLHMVDLSKLAAVNAAIDTFTAAVQANPDANLLAIGKARNNAQAFAKVDPDAERVFSSVDLIDFMRLLKDLTDDAAVKDAAQGVIDAAQAMVVYGGASPTLPGAHGVAVFFPANKDDYAIGGHDGRYPSEFNDLMPSWITFLDTFYGIATSKLSPSALTIKIDQVIPNDGSASIWDQPVVLFSTSGSGIVDIEFYAALELPDKNYAILVDSSSLEFSYLTEAGDEINQYPEGESGSLEFSWNVEMPRMTDAAGNTEITVLISNPDNAEEATVSGIYHYQDGSTTRAYLVVDTTTQQVKQVFGLQAGEGEDEQAVGEIKPTSGDTFEPHYRFLGEDGTIQLVESGTQLVFSDTPFTYEYIPAAQGNYIFTMWVKDLAGNISYDSTKFAINNEGLDKAYRGFKDLGLGLNFLIPWGWADPFVTVKADESYRLDVSDPTGAITFYVDSFAVKSIDDILKIATDNLTTFGAEFDAPVENDITTSNDESDEVTYSAYNLNYSYTSDDGTDYVGHELVIYVPENGLGYVIDLDVPADQSDYGDSLFNDMLYTIYFFIPQ